MALHWDMKECAEDAEVLWSDENKVVTDMMIWFTLFVDIGYIDPKDTEKFYRRVYAYESAHGPMLLHVAGDGSGPQPRRITFANVERYAGLRTNVTTTTEAQFRAKLMRTLYQEANTAIARERKEATEEAA